MKQLRRGAAVVAALLLATISWAVAQAPPHALPAGSAVVFVSDGHLDVGAKPGSTIKVHLRDDLVVDGASIASAGTAARLVLGGATGSAGARQALISLDEFVTKPGLLPVGPVRTSLAQIDVGTLIPAKTLATVDHLGDRFSIEVPFPFPLSNDVPVSQYTPTPAKTASPRGFSQATPRPLATAAPTSPAATAEPAPTKTPGS